MSKYRHAIQVAVGIAVLVGFVALAGYYDSRAKAEAERIDAEMAAAIEAAEVAKIDMSRKRTFRDTYWGMTRLQVKATEKWHHKPILSGKDYLYYEGEIFNAKCRLFYSFAPYYAENKLSRAWYTFPDLKEKEAQALRILIGSIMAKKYGHYHSESNTRNSATGRLEYDREWVVDEETKITLTYTLPERSWDKDDFEVSVSYNSVEKWKWREERRLTEKGKKEMEEWKKKEERKAREAARVYEKAAANF